MIKYKRRASVEINSSSMADIAFLLLIFFLVTTTISMDQGIEIVLPSEGEEMKVNKNNITVISINESGKVLFNGRFVREKSLAPNNLYQLKSLVENEIAKNDKMIFSIQTTDKTKYSDYMKVLDYVKQANATKISIAN
tara:strand:- start:815 stop:1228 length:414 start_codon:yes stop_codon:yes gene_type:complete